MSLLRVGWLVALVGLALSACETTQQPTSTVAAAAGVEVKDPDSPTKVGVVSILGDQIFHTKVGFTVFGNAKSQADASDLQLDQYFADTLIETLNGYEGYTAVASSLDEQSIARIYGAEGEETYDKSVRTFKRKVMLNELVKLGTENNLDQVVVISPSSSGIFTTNQSAQAIGTFAWTYSNYAYMTAVIGVVDVRTQKIESSITLRPAYRMFSEGYLLCNLNGTGVISLPYEEYGDEEKKNLKLVLQEMADYGIPLALAKMLLGNTDGVVPRVLFTPATKCRNLSSLKQD